MPSYEDFVRDYWAPDRTQVLADMQKQQPMQSGMSAARIDPATGQMSSTGLQPIPGQGNGSAAGVGNPGATMAGPRMWGGGQIQTPWNIFGGGFTNWVGGPQGGYNGGYASRGGAFSDQQPSAAGGKFGNIFQSPIGQQPGMYGNLRDLGMLRR